MKHILNLTRSVVPAQKYTAPNVFKSSLQVKRFTRDSISAPAPSRIPRSMAFRSHQLPDVWARRIMQFQLHVKCLFDEYLSEMECRNRTGQKRMRLSQALCSATSRCLVAQQITLTAFISISIIYDQSTSQLSSPFYRYTSYKMLQWYVFFRYEFQLTPNCNLV